MKPALYLRNAHVVTEHATFFGGVVVEGTQISQLVAGNPDLEAESVVDLNGKVLLPGLVDDHVHFNEPGRTDWEGYRTGSRAAVAGGVTTVLEMPLNATPPTIDRQKLMDKREAASAEAVADYAQWGGLVDDNLDCLEELHSEGVIGFKAFLSTSGTDFERIDDGLLYAGLLKARELGNVVGLHAENEYVTRYLTQQLRSRGRTDRAAYLASRPPATELEAVRRSLFWAGQTGGTIHIVHTTLAAAFDAVQEARSRGVRVTAETCPHYLVFDSDDFVRIGPEAKCAPPIRTRQEVESLWDCVLRGRVDVIASDHSPCPVNDKEMGNDDIWKAWGGITGIQTMLPALLTEGVHKRGLSLSSLVRMMSANPARIFGIYPQKGALVPGADADLVVVDLDREWTLTADQLYSKNQHSAYVGYGFKGAVERTIIRGVTVYNKGEFQVARGFGQLVRPRESRVF